VGAVVFVVVVVVAAAVVALGVVTFNRLIAARNGVREAWAQIDVLLDRRHRLIADLVRIAAGAADFERSTLEAVTAARDAAERAPSPAPKGEAEREIGRAAQLLFARAEAYPQLGANAAFGQLQGELVATEDELAASRRYYNGRVKRYHDAIESFPAVLVAARLGYRRNEYFQADEDERDAPAIR